MRFNKLIYIRYIPLTAKIYKDFYMEEVAQAGIEVEYWDISALFFKDTVGQEDSSLLTKTRIFNTYKELEENLIREQPLDDKLFISIMTFEGRVSELYKLFTKYNCNLAVFGRNMFPLSQQKISWKFVLEKVNITKIKSYLRTKKIIKEKEKGLIKPYDIVFLGGKKGWQGIGAISESELSKAEVIKVNSDDYDNALLLKGSIPIIDTDYILFLDEYLPLHPDTLLFKIRNVSAEQYYPQLNKYFDLVEKQFGIPVVIAAHPKGYRYKGENFFNSRKVIFGKVSELTEHAYFVLAHDSTSINYPIAFGKKLHFITSFNISKYINRVHRNVVSYADFLGCNWQWFDKEDRINLVAEIPKQDYQKYKFDFQTSPETENKLSKDIFLEFLKNGQ